MADELISMYCGRDAIHGMYGERSRCFAMLDCAERGEICIALIYMNGTREWVYGQCTFKHEPDHIAPFKFSNTFGALKEQNVLPTLIRSHGVTTIFIDDAELGERLGTDPLTAKYRNLITVLSEAKGTFQRQSEPAGRSFLSGLGVPRR